MMKREKPKSGAISQKHFGTSNDLCDLRARINRQPGLEGLNEGPFTAFKGPVVPLTHSSLLLSPPAVYLCKRTMQNKARLELADYEAVSGRPTRATSAITPHSRYNRSLIPGSFVLK